MADTSALDCLVAYFANRGLYVNGPIIAGISGPQGSGKSTLASNLVNVLKQAPYNLNVLACSLDDFYRPHQELLDLSQSGNTLWQKRGLPGTHDSDLCYTVLQSMKNQQSVEIPSFDKSLFKGEGDRASIGLSAHPPYDLILLEGWCVGFTSIDEKQLRVRYEAGGPLIKSHSFKDVQVVNAELAKYDRIWNLFDVMIQLAAKDISYVYDWRLQQEHGLIQMRRSGMTDDQVKLFVDMYMPAYAMWLDTIQAQIRLELDINRHVVSEYRSPNV